MLGDIRDIAMFMLYLTGAYLFLTNAGGFSSILNTVGSNWRDTLVVLQGRAAA